MKALMSKRWAAILAEELAKPYIQDLIDFVEKERMLHPVFPLATQVFEALNHTPFETIQVVILGQDPYHQPGQANGLAFSVGAGTKIPPSLRNMYKELNQDCSDFEIPNHGDLSAWAKQGVLLLNTTLSVRENEAGSHQKRGWEALTDAIIKKISEQRSGVVFLLWGKFAQDKMRLIDQSKHHVLCTAHPSPLSAYRGFFGSKPFSKTNALLLKDGKKPIDWKLSVQ